MEERKDNLEKRENVRFKKTNQQKLQSDFSGCIDKTSENQLTGIYKL